jgi:hypothetical protein
MSLSRWPPNPVKVARQTFYTFLVIAVVGLIGGPLFVFRGIHANRRDLPSLQWPRTTGIMTQCDKEWYAGGHSVSHWIEATYTYAVNNQQYVGHNITLWDPTLHGTRDQTGNFAAAHPISSSVDVYYDPQNPGNAVLIPGADESGNRVSIYGGAIAFASALLSAFRLPAKYAAYKGQLELQKTEKSF